MFYRGYNTPTESMKEEKRKCPISHRNYSKINADRDGTSFDSPPTIDLYLIAARG